MYPLGTYFLMWQSVLEQVDNGEVAENSSKNKV